jgi:hypothetical protein
MKIKVWLIREQFSNTMTIAMKKILAGCWVGGNFSSRV